MIDISYNEGIKIETGHLDKILSKEQLPIKVEIKNVVSKKTIWSTELNNFMWASYPNNEMVDVVIKDAKDNFIYQYYWDVLIHGSIFYKSLWLYCKGLNNKGVNPNGLVIGTHDGEFGEWCPLVRFHLSEMVLVEGSKKQFDRLVENYGQKQGLTLIHDLITTDGSNVEFFEGGEGYTNSIVERVIRGWEKDEIKSTIRQSTSINDLIYNNFIIKGKKLDWLHLDVEGMDAKLIMSLKEEHIPNFIIFEDFNLETWEKKDLMDWLSKRNFLSKSESGICFSTR
jgi:hypothetical protein